MRIAQSMSPHGASHVLDWLTEIGSIDSGRKLSLGISATMNPSSQAIVICALENSIIEGSAQ